MSRWLFLFLSLVAISACKKTTQEVSYRAYQLPDRMEVKSLAFHSDSMWFATAGRSAQEGRMFRSIDSGQTWEQILRFESLLCPYDILLLGDSSFLVGSDLLYLFRSENLGDSTTGIFDQPWQPANINQRGPIQFIAEDGGRILFAGGHFATSGGFGVSNDTGRTFEYYPMGKHLAGVWLQDKTAFITGYGIVMRSMDGAQTFDTLDIQEEFFLDIDGPSSAELLLLAHSGKIFKTIDGGTTWDEVYNRSFLGNQRNLSDLQWVGGGTYVAVGSKGLILKSTDRGNTWTEITGLPPIHYTKVIHFKGFVYIGGDGGRIVRIAL